jgi:DNA-binding MarR family transcriptional regulator
MTSRPETARRDTGETGDTADQTPGDAVLRRFIGYDMKRAFNAVQADLNATLAPFGLRMVTYSVLAVVCANPGIRQSRLAEVLSIERPNLVLILDDLERAEAVERVRAPDDRRAYELSPTLRGRRLCDRATRAVDAHDARIAKGIDPGTLAALHSALRRIEGNGQTEDPETPERPDASQRPGKPATSERNASERVRLSRS